MAPGVIIRLLASCDFVTPVADSHQPGVLSRGVGWIPSSGLWPPSPQGEGENCVS